MSKEWDFVSKGTEISLGTFVLEHFTPLTLDVQTGVVSSNNINVPYTGVNVLLKELGKPFNGIPIKF